jgi:hypothetical protein
VGIAPDEAHRWLHKLLAPLFNEAKRDVQQLLDLWQVWDAEARSSRCAQPVQRSQVPFMQGLGIWACHEL